MTCDRLPLAWPGIDAIPKATYNKKLELVLVAGKQAHGAEYWPRCRHSDTEGYSQR